MRRVIILGSTGSIGTQALDVIRSNPGRFEVVGLAAGSDAAGVRAQADEFDVEDTALGAVDAEQLVRDVDADVVINGITGSVGLGPTLAALETGKTLALANKESLIVGGDLVTAIAEPGQIVPVDSEHSALAQALKGNLPSDVRRLVVTASGGPFRGFTREQLASVTPQQALAHPTWDMGKVVTTNSATLVNKGLEVIEAHLLFSVSYSKIEVVVHPQSIVHSMVEYADGSTMAQASPPDMRLPISLGLDWPSRISGVGTPLDWTKATQWTFEPLDNDTFPAVALAKDMTPIICVGEGLDIRKAGEHVAYTLAQVEGCYAELSAEDAVKTVIAYEPVWAIGTGEVATPEDAQEVCGAIRGKLEELYGAEVAAAVRVLYGGSVKSSNVAAIMAKDDIDGALVGGASLQPEEFAGIARFKAVS